MPGSRPKYAPPRPLSAKTLRGTTKPIWDGREYDADTVTFLVAVDRYKRERRRPFPTWAEVLAVARALGYRKGE